ncbi:hypothetical protein DSL72_000723 [Monilinia vaccinii-corymbosi]|uniref:Uncharacterized protein n=1 Tax=Monilinia vaccinii-corymbosi TaxID=61207 RepID=A0A8A3P3H8_9HELO|nr:hypothetical protein DSL72_000723 [Monilinia vaccinii-corymbosi]
MSLPSWMISKISPLRGSTYPHRAAKSKKANCYSPFLDRIFFVRDAVGSLEPRASLLVEHRWLLSMMEAAGKPEFDVSTSGNRKATSATKTTSGQNGSRFLIRSRLAIFCGSVDISNHSSGGTMAALGKYEHLFARPTARCYGKA